MAGSGIRSGTARSAGLAALAFLGLLAGGALAGLVSESLISGSAGALAIDAYLWRAARFTLWQALLSTALSVLPAIIVARALFRLPDGKARRLILNLFAVPFALPAIVAALGVLALYGSAGWLAPAFSVLSGGPWTGIFGLSGILVAHVFFNLPLAARLLLGGPRSSAS